MTYKMPKRIIQLDPLPARTLDFFFTKERQSTKQSQFVFSVGDLFGGHGEEPFQLLLQFLNQCRHGNHPGLDRGRNNRSYRRRNREGHNHRRRGGLG